MLNYFALILSESTMTCSPNSLFCPISEWDFLSKFPESCRGGVRRVRFEKRLVCLDSGGRSKAVQFN